MGSNNQDIPKCLVCYSDLLYPALAPCGHDDVCGLCHLRLRHLLGDSKCPICKTENNQLVVDSFHEKKERFDDYPIWGDELGTGFFFRENVGMFFPQNYYDQQIQPLFGYYCTIPTCSYDGITPDQDICIEVNNNNKNKKQKQKQQMTPLRALQDHLRNKHRLALCNLCVEFKRDFVARLPRMTPSQLKNHLSKGDGPESGFQGHPVCEFCRPTRFYDLAQLHKHLNKDHYKCDLCDRRSLPNQFFRDYQALEKHFDQQHFLCHDVQCLQARFVVFDNELDLRAHEQAVHGAASHGGKIQLEFRVRREGYDGSGYEQSVPRDEDFGFGLDGQPFVPEALPLQNAGPDAETSHPLHLQRTQEIRAEAARVRHQMEAKEESNQEHFPTLGETATASTEENRLRMGWTSEGALRKVTKRPGVSTNSQQDFPSLPASANRKMAAKPRANGNMTGNRQFAAMRNAAMGVPTTNQMTNNNNNNNNWGGATTPTTAASDFPALGSGITTNRRTVAAASDFPGLGGSTIATAGTNEALNRRAVAAAAPNLSSGNDFPALGGGGGGGGGSSSSRASTSHRYEAAEALGRKNQQNQQNKPPSFTVAHFPPPPPTTTSKKESVRLKVLKKAAPPANNMTNFPLPESTKSMAMATVDQMKAALGPTKYKRLKNLTKEFATDVMDAHAYVDQSATLFDGGYTDEDFWFFVPSLLASLPNESSAKKALRYLDHIKQQGATTTAQEQNTRSNWTAAAAAASIPPNQDMAAHSWPPPSSRAPPVVRNTAQVAYPALSSKKKSAWGASGGGASSVVRVKAAKGSVAVAAANQRPQAGTATKFMAKQQKQVASANNNNNKSGKKKKKQRDELRTLAFGK